MAKGRTMVRIDNAGEKRMMTMPGEIRRTRMRGLGGGFEEE